MEISFLGHASFKIRSKDTTVVTDPYEKAMVGFPFPKTEAEIVTVSHSHEDHSAQAQVGGNPFVITGPGEYEVKGILIFGTGCFHDSSAGSERGTNTIYTFEIEGLRLCHLGDLGHKLTPEQLEELNGIDLLFIPVGGVYTLGPQEAVEVIAQIEPKIVIPMHYKVAGMNPTFAQLAQVEDFLKAVGEEVSPLPKLVVSSEKLPEERQIIVLQRRGA